jgi:hypothetical protein
MNPKWGAFPEPWRHFLCACGFLPNQKFPSMQRTIMDRLYQVAADTKEIVRASVHRQKF